MVKNLSNRQILILSFFEKHSKATSKELAEFLAVSQRTVKNEMSYLQRKFPEFNIISKPGFGYFCIADFAGETNKLGLYYRDKDLILQNYDRIASILYILLQSNSYIKYDKIAEMLFVSRSTLQKDMLIVKKLVNMYKLSIMQKPNYGIKIHGSEYDKRIALVHYFYNSFWGVLNKYYMNKKYKLSDETIKKIMFIIRRNLTDEIIMPDNLVELLAKKVFVAIIRRDISVKIPGKISFLNERKVAKAIILECEKITGEVLVQENLIDYVAHYVHGYNTNIKINESDNVDYDRVLEAILSEVYSNYDLNFFEDNLIINNLKNQIIQVTHRIKMQTVLDDKFKFIYFKDYLFKT